MNVEMGTKKEFPEKEYINGIFLAVYTHDTNSLLSSSRPDQGD
jgi:hypothetical protein